VPAGIFAARESVAKPREGFIGTSQVSCGYFSSSLAAAAAAVALISSVNR